MKKLEQKMFEGMKIKVEKLKEENKMLENDIINSEMNLKRMTDLYEQSQSQNREYVEGLKKSLKLLKDINLGVGIGGAGEQLIEDIETLLKGDE